MAGLKRLLTTAATTAPKDFDGNAYLKHLPAMLRNYRIAANTILAILAAVTLFHLAILAGLIPFSLVWGGRLRTQEQMLQFETISIAINMIMAFFTAVAAGHLLPRLSRRLVAVVFVLMTILFLLNTAGNLASLNTVEKRIFTPLTFGLALLSGWVAWALYNTPPPARRP